MEQHKRTFFKTMTWRLIALSITVVVVYVYSGDARESIVVGLTANAIKMAFYYIHERVWNRINFGRLEKPDYSI